MNPFMLREAIASVSLSHDTGHDCDTCKAARRDEDGLIRVLESITNHETRSAQEEFAKTTDHWTSPEGVEWAIHNAEACKGHSCAFHNPSDHPMKDWPVDMNTEKDLLVERICSHDIRHPDPDSLDYLSREVETRQRLEKHECDGCCRDVGNQ